MLDFNELMAEATKTAEEEGLKFKAKDGKVVLLRPLLQLSAVELKNVMTLLPKVSDKKTEDTDKLDYAAMILVAVADKKDSMRKSLDALPLVSAIKILEEWMEKAGSDLPESEGSTSS